MTGSDSSTIAVIPARYGSRRLPGKPLLSETGKPLIQHVYERVQQAHTIGRTLVATDDERIAEAVRGFGGNVVMTSPDHPSGTDRVAEAVAGLDVERVVNVQGDEPDINPEILDTLVAQLDHSEMATLAVKFSDPGDASSPHRVKVLIGDEGFASTFTRAPLNGESAIPHNWDCHREFRAWLGWFKYSGYRYTL